MLKAAAGGGGRGMRRVDDPADLAHAMAAAAREAQAAFGDGTLYAERMIAPARHVEVQLLGDRHGGLAVLRGARLQRPAPAPEAGGGAPSPAVTPEVRAALAESARRVAGTVDFHSAATVEFLLDAEGGHYFLEMNTRLQVEHGVTELVTGIDMVAWQIRVAEGTPWTDPCWSRASPATPSRSGSTPRTRTTASARWPAQSRLARAGRPGHPRRPRRGRGEPLTAEYDPLLAKLMVHAHDRPAAVARLRRALDETLVGGLQTDLGFHRWLVDHPGLRRRRLPHRPHRRGLARRPPPAAEDLALAATAAIEARLAAGRRQRPSRRERGRGPVRGPRLARREAFREERP